MARNLLEPKLLRHADRIRTGVQERDSVFLRGELEREIGKDQASLAAKCPTENALRASMLDCESKSLRDFIPSNRAALKELP